MRPVLYYIEAKIKTTYCETETKSETRQKSGIETLTRGRQYKLPTSSYNHHKNRLLLVKLTFFK